MVHEPLDLLGLVDLDLHKPALAVRVDVDEGRVLHHVLVHRLDGAGDRGDELDDGLLGLELSDRVPGLDEPSDFGVRHRYDLSQLLLGVLRKSETGRFAHLEDPKVVL